jgi:hypothetical protein
MLADAAALIVFVILGVRGHRASALEGFLRNAVPLLASWYLVAWLVHTYRRPGWRSLLRNWIVAVPIRLPSCCWSSGACWRGCSHARGERSVLVAVVVGRQIPRWLRASP